MCGLFGGTGLNNLSHDFLENITIPMKNRGPDSFGSWINTDKNFFLAFRRLSIIDLSQNANQPMASKNKRFILAFNGEVYNFHEIKNKLIARSKINFETSSDTEVLLNSIQSIGLEETLKIIDGMFSFALWDNLNNELFLVRDKMGQKPLYYYRTSENFLFMSDLSILNKMKIKKTIDKSSLNSFLDLSYIPHDKSIYKECNKVKPGSYLKVSNNFKKIDFFQYWKPKILNQKKSMLQNIETLDNLLDESVNKTMISDVPIGSFLSGGVDSSIISYYMQKNSHKRIETFTIGYNEKEYSESESAKKISKYLNSNHNELIINATDIMNIIPTLGDIYSEPFADSSQIPTFLLSKFASNKVKVVLTGDGADELFGGYNRHIYAKTFYPLIKSSPVIFKKLFLNIIKIIKNNLNKPILKKNLHIINYENIDKIQSILESNNYLDLYNSFISNSFDQNKVNNEYLTINESSDDLTFNLILLLDQMHYLPNDILCKSDRASMYSSIESRSPFLNKNIINFANSLNANHKVNYFSNKVILRKLMKNFYPDNLIKKEKKGFSIPINLWIKDELLDWSESLIDNIKTSNSDYL